jgi:predicted HAD superfamily Cof-like phosphohydrolase
MSTPPYNIFKDIRAFNTMYGLPDEVGTPKMPNPGRITQFLAILREELEEAEEPRLVLEDEVGFSEDQEEAAMIEYADLLGDIVVFALSEGLRFGFPMDRVLKAIMDSNFSKLDSNGDPIVDPVTNKILKGPNYAPPTNDIAKALYPFRRVRPATT